MHADLEAPMRRFRSPFRSAVAVAATAVVAAGVVRSGSLAAHAAAGCRVVYTVTSQWQGGLGASVNVTNLGDPVPSWGPTRAFPAGQTVTQLWNGTVTQSGAQVAVVNAAWNGGIGTGGAVTGGVEGAWKRG